MRYLTGVLLLLVAGVTRGDSLTLKQVMSELDSGTVIDFASGVDKELSQNLLVAQAQAYYTKFEPDSLLYSIESVLKAVTLYSYPGGPILITSEKLEPIVWIQSRIAIDTRATATLTPSSLDFGTVPVVATPEPDGLPIVVLVLLFLLLDKARGKRGRRLL